MHDFIVLVNMEDALFMPKIVEKALKDWLKIRENIKPEKPEYDKYLFLHPNNHMRGRKLAYWYVLRLCKKIGELAGMKDIVTTPLCLKRTEITRDFDHFQNFRIPQIRARHTNVKSTLRYCTKSYKDVVKWVQSERYMETPPEDM